MIKLLCVRLEAIKMEKPHFTPNPVGNDEMDEEEGTIGMQSTRKERP